VVQAVDGYFEGDSHSCRNGSRTNDKIPKLVKLTEKKVRNEINSCREEIAEINKRVKLLLSYEKELRNGSTAQQK
jgi:hypothetical protein